MVQNLFFLIIGKLPLSIILISALFLVPIFPFRKKIPWQRFGFQFKTPSTRWLIILCCIAFAYSALILYVYYLLASFLKQQIEPPSTHSPSKQGLVNSAETAQESIPEKDVSTVNCVGWDLCADFKTDTKLDNKYYSHAKDDPQVLILEGGPFPNPPLYLNLDTKPFYKLQLEVLPMNPEAANITVESRGIFKLFIGDSDYRSLALLTWDPRQNIWARDKDSKIYLGGDLNKPDIKPQTQLTLSVESKKKGNDAEVAFHLTYETEKGGKDTAEFTRFVDILAAEPEKYLTRIGVGLYRSSNIPQAKFQFVGLKIK